MTRIRCCVPHCGRTTKSTGFDEWVCQRHWSVVPRRMRLLYTRVKRRMRANPGEVKWRVMAARVWIRCRDKAIEIAFGL